MIADIARIRCYHSIGKYTYEKAKDMLVGDVCIVNTEEGQEFGTIVSFSKLDVNEMHLVKFDDNGHVIKTNDDSSSNDKHHKDHHDSKRKGVRIKNDTHKIYEVARKATEEDLKRYNENKAKEDAAFKECKQMIHKHSLEMKLIDVHYFFDRSKLLFEFVADHRVDFRELVKDLAAHFRTRIELRQIGVRDEAKIVGGCGVCGRELCCNLMKSEFEAISIKMAKEQNMPLNTAKISGQCGRLMCCLNYEYETYRSIKKDLPHAGQRITFNGSPAFIQDVNPLSRNVLIKTEDDRFIYVKADDIVKKNNHMFVNLSVE